MNRQMTPIPVALCARVSGDRQDVDIPVSAGAAGPRREERPPRFPTVHRRGRGRQNRRPTPVPADDRGAKQSLFFFPRDPDAGEQREIVAILYAIDR